MWLQKLVNHADHLYWHLFADYVNAAFIILRIKIVKMKMQILDKRFSFEIIFDEFVE